MSLERLWAGWRMPYVAGAGAGPTAAGVEATQPGPAGASGAGVGTEGDERRCPFCRILASGEPDEATCVVWRGARCVALLNAFPYASGHLMVMPTRHVAGLDGLEAAEAAELWPALTDAVAAVTAAYRPEGLNVGMNLGRAAGAGIPGHLHVHVVPRWNGDTNFMTAVAGARVLPEALPVSWQRLRSAWPGA